jgi:hypothetical protein
MQVNFWEVSAWRAEAFTCFPSRVLVPALAALYESISCTGPAGRLGCFDYESKGICPKTTVQQVFPKIPLIPLFFRSVSGKPLKFPGISLVLG